MQFSIQKWLRISLFNLIVISILGLILRYKIVFSLPFIDQKHWLQAHSHFAFSGWISQTLMVCMVSFLEQRGLKNAFQKYHQVLLFNLIAAYGMLLCFPFQGYGLFSISFSTFSIFTSYYFTWMFWNDLKNEKVNEIASSWFKAALMLNIISSIGAFTLAYMMANKIVHQNWYLAAVYFFLHFQYNGWFFFACAGLWFSKIKRMQINIANEKTIFWLFAIAVVPCYLLSTLWMKFGLVIYWLVVIAALLQVLALMLILKSIYINRKLIKSNLLKISTNLLSLSLLAFVIKILLQLLSTIPDLNQLSYGFRPIVIGYLHLVLLGFISLFIIAFCFANYYLKINHSVKNGAIVFTSGIIINEFLLMLQGSAALNSMSIPYNNELLLGAALILFSGAFMMFYSQLKQTPTRQ